MPGGSKWALSRHVRAYISHEFARSRAARRFVRMERGMAVRVVFVERPRSERNALEDTATAGCPGDSSPTPTRARTACEEYGTYSELSSPAAGPLERIDSIDDRDSLIVTRDNVEELTHGAHRRDIMNRRKTCASASQAYRPHGPSNSLLRNGFLRSTCERISRDDVEGTLGSKEHHIRREVDVPNVKVRA